MSLLNNLLSKIHFIVLAYIGWTVYEGFTQHEQKIEILQQEQVTIQNKVTILKKKIKKAETFKKNLEISEQRVEEVEKQINEVQRQLPNEIRDTEVLDFLSTQAEDINLKELFLTPLKESLNDFYYAKEFEIKAIGTYLQTLIFFERLSFADRLYNITDMKLSRSKKAKQGRFQLIALNVKLETFRYNPGYTAQLKQKAAEKIKNKKNKGGRRRKK
jgi:Tfp pilus assembly protein PilO